MMHLWAVIYIMGKVSATFGPFDPEISYEQCMATAIEQAADWDKAWIEKDLAHSPKMVFEGHQLERSDITTTCVWSATRPQ